MKKLIRKTVVRLIIFAVITAALAAVKESAVITNDMALGQLENSDTAYMLMHFVQNMNSVITLLYVAFAAMVFWPIVVDVYKIIKKKYSKEETKE